MTHPTDILNAVTRRLGGVPPDPDGMNASRSEWAGKAIYAFMSETGTEPEHALTDLLCDLMHWADRHKDMDFNAALQYAIADYRDETTA